VKDDLARSARRRKTLSKSRGKEPTLAQSLAWVGVLGWLIMGPTLAGLALGRFIDRHEGGIRFTAAFLFLGVAAGCWLAWRRIHEP
jgi:ATP synthase protein I